MTEKLEIQNIENNERGRLDYHDCPVSKQRITNDFPHGFNHRDTRVISFCPWCGVNLHYARYMTQGFFDFLREQGFEAEEIDKAWGITVSLLDDMKSNHMRSKDIMQIVCTDILRNGKDFFVLRDHLYED